MEAAPHVRDVLEFLTSRGFASAADALRLDALDRGGDELVELELIESPPRLPPLKLSPESRAGGFGGGDGESSSSSGDFVSMGSSPSEMLNPYRIWSPSRKSDDSSVRQSEFGTARAYNDSNLFGDTYWYGDQYGDFLNDSFFIMPNSAGCPSEDKFVMSMDSEEQLGSPNDKSRSIGCVSDKHGYNVDLGCEGCKEIYSSSSPLRDPFSELKGGQNGDARELVKNTSSCVYGCYRILDDHTEILDECEDGGIQLKRVDGTPREVPALHGGSLYEPSTGRKKEILESDRDPACEPKTVVCLDCPQKATFISNMDGAELQKEDGVLQTFEREENDAYELGDWGPIVRESRDAVSADVGKEHHGTFIEPQFYDTFEDDYEIFDLRIVHRKNRTGFEENKDLPIVMDSVIAGRYYVTEYLGSAAFSKVVQAQDLQTGVDVCLKIIKNDKDFFDQSLDEIKLLKYVNKYDPADKCHILRLYDYFYYQEHLFIVCELLRANLYEFQKYNQDSGAEVYFTLPRIQSIAQQCLEALQYLHQLKIIHCDLKPENILIKSYARCEIKVIDLGSSCFQTDNLSLYVQSRSYRAPEVILGLSYDQKIDIWSLGCVLAELYSGDVLFPNESVAMMLARMVGILGPIDMEMLEMGQETSKYFTDGYDIYDTNEETGQLECLVPEKTSLARELQLRDPVFLDFLQHLLQINPQRRPSASEALQHQWLSFRYS